MKFLTPKQFMNTYGLKNQTMSTSDLIEKLSTANIKDVSIYPRDSIVKSTKGICNNDDGSQGGTHWVAFYIFTEGSSSYFDSFGGPPDQLLTEQLPKPIKYHNYIIQGIHSMMCGTYCLYFLYLLENNINYEDAVMKIFLSYIMPMNVFGSTSSTNQANLDTTLFVQKPYLRTNYLKSDLEEDIDMKQKFKIKNLVDPTNGFDAANKTYIDKYIKESTILRIPTYEPLTNDYVSLKNVESNKVKELATSNYVNNDISVKNYNKTDDIIYSIDVANHDFTPTIVTLPTKEYIDSKLTETNNRARRSITENLDIMRQDLEHTFASKFVYNNFYEIHLTGRTKASSEVSPDNSFLAIPYSIFTVTGPNAKVAQVHVSALNVNIGSRYTLRFLIQSESLTNVTFGFAGQSSTEHFLTYDFKLIESTATHTNINEFNVFIDLSSLSVGETVEIAALYIEY